MRRIPFTNKFKFAIVFALLLIFGGSTLYRAHNVEWAARVTWGEARGETDDGMQAVLNVMVNRSKSPRFPQTLSGVAKQKLQFSAYNVFDANRNKLIDVKDTDTRYRKALALAKRAQAGTLPDLTGGAIFYHSKEIARPSYLSHATVSAVIGNHIFYTTNDSYYAQLQ
ncbi:MAG: cell wall hydrolase [Kordiimonadaceae bacterium]|nr:cell wall hydrolase [Kordiimonadaceae bacterium]MBL4791287.1 cell wall hydrolase [Kordiimonadaceae bacterium]